ncbi:putative disease resistance protein At3g14460 [Zingiber officinale]|uniref:putative disease resistance protein At3g14460 n=1 Tax=Zingiber officinale TaxID=94328 RepID=UPI001C4B8131|nr:putative disease resistance protein At3g14460 [Zingiber officinale]XP_042470165.1 putative disease resistance protein At3g14460 [Zingiber officinale]XP_042470166.1 putative disease resistance protein At3g14460 [Zingiber officinale]
MDPILIIITIVGWMATPLMTKLINSAHLLRNQRMSDQLNRLKQRLYAIGKMAENAQIGNWQADVPYFRDWLRRFKDVIYDAEDVIYSHKLDERQIDKILEKFQRLTNEIEDFLQGLNKREEIPTWRKTTYLMSRSIRGRTTQINELENWLLSDQSTNSSKNFSLQSIVGPGGIGKTVLSQLVFNNPEVQQKFEVTAWVLLCNPTTPDIKIKPSPRSLYQKIISLFQTNDSTNTPEILDEFESKFESRMKGKTFFMVLDDMRELPTNWDNFYWPLFNCGKQGSKIIVTTQFERTANMIDSDLPINLDVLEQDQYWELFKECAFGHNSTPSHHSVLEDVGRNISNKFGCSPLAAVEVGRELKCSLNKTRWNSISHNKFCIVDRRDGDIISILGLCYEQLPERLKQCYLSCALFPRNYPFEEEELNLIWIGLGFLHFESKTTNYVDDFSKRSFLVNATRTNGRYVFHHVLHELAEYISDGEFLRLEEEIRGCEDTEIPSHTRHLYINANNFVEATKALGKNSKLRSLVIVGGLSIPDHKRTFLKYLEKVLEKLEFLRFLVLPLPPTNLSETVGTLKYLRYLQFPKNQQELPKLSNSILGKYKLKLWNGCNYLLVSNDINKLIQRHCSLENIEDLSDLVP